MKNKSITVEIFGIDNSIIQQQKSIIENLDDATINCHTDNDYIENSDRLHSNSDLIIVNLSNQGHEELKSIEHAFHSHGNIIAIGDKKDVKLLSLAISAGVSEFIDKTDYQSNLLTIVKKLLHKSSNERQAKKGQTIAVINAKGGSGASFIASNIAFLKSQKPNANTALIDLDLQFGTIGLNFDITPRYTIDKVLENISGIDYLELEAHMATYEKTLKLLLPPQDEIILNEEISPASIKSMLNLTQRNYTEVIIDLPRLIDQITINVLEQADHILVVVQQSLAHFRDGKRLVNILNKDLDIALDRISVIINRYDSKSSLSRSDLANAVNHQHILTVSNDFKNVSLAGNLGSPFCRTKPKSKVTKDLKSISSFLEIKESNHDKSARPNFIKRLFVK